MTGPCYRVVLPVYLDVESFEILRSRALHELAGDGVEPRPVHFVVVDDSAGYDPQMAQLKGRPDITVVQPPFNLGHQRALVAGLRTIKDDLADDDIVITMDSDGEDRPEDLPRLVAAVDSADPSRVVIARRTTRKVNLRFRVLYVGFRLMFRILTGCEVRSGNFAAFTGRYGRQMLSHPSFDLCYSSSLITLNAQPVFVPCPRGERYAGRSRMGIEKLLTHGVRMLMPFADRIAVRSLAVCMATAGLTLVLLLGLILVGILGDGGASVSWTLALVCGLVVAGLGLVNFLVLFASHVHTAALSLARVDEQVVVE